VKTLILCADGPCKAIVVEIASPLKVEAIHEQLYRDTGEVRKDMRVYRWVGKAELRRKQGR
jgi:hypothetical protein